MSAKMEALKLREKTCMGKITKGVRKKAPREWDLKGVFVRRKSKQNSDMILQLSKQG